MNTGTAQRNTPRIPAAPVSPVLQFVLLLAPIVMNGFFSVYALTGWLIDGRDRFNWSIEAPRVAFWIGGGIMLYSLVVLVYARWRGARLRHPLILSSVIHTAIASALVVTTLLAVYG